MGILNLRKIYNPNNNDSDILPILSLNLTVGQKCKIWPHLSATRKQAGMLLLSSICNSAYWQTALYNISKCYPLLSYNAYNNISTLPYPRRIRLYNLWTTPNTLAQWISVTVMSQYTPSFVQRYNTAIKTRISANNTDVDSSAAFFDPVSEPPDAESFRSLGDDASDEDSHNGDDSPGGADVRRVGVERHGALLTLVRRPLVTRLSLYCHLCRGLCLGISRIGVCVWRQGRWWCLYTVQLCIIVIVLVHY